MGWYGWKWSFLNFHLEVLYPSSNTSLEINTCAANKINHKQNDQILSHHLFHRDDFQLHSNYIWSTCLRVKDRLGIGNCRQNPPKRLKSQLWSSKTQTRQISSAPTIITCQKAKLSPWRKISRISDYFCSTSEKGKHDTWNFNSVTFSKCTPFLILVPIHSSHFEEEQN